MSTVTDELATSDPAVAGAIPHSRSWRRLLVRHGWTIGVWVLLALLIVWYSTLIPSFGSFQMASIAKNSLPLVFLALGQAVIVIAGGVDLSIGAQMVLASVVAARYMDEQPFAATLAVGVGVVILLAMVNGTVGLIVYTSKVPDIVVTLATSFIISGAALWVLPSPGGGTSAGFRAMFTGSEFGSGENFWPPIVVIAVSTTVVALVLRRTRTGLSLYAVGSDSTAAYLSGVGLRRSKVTSYAIGGALAGMAGLATIAITGSGDPRASVGANATLNSVAAIVLGGIALTGGVGSVVGAVAAAIILFFLNPILSAMKFDPNTAQVIQGVLIIVVMMIAGLLERRRRRAE
ncbi:MAG: ABC transporter permease [Acidimicrobiia bacterium]|nr:ABC transporter permease [Acidimicrobiia bacterium]